MALCDTFVNNIDCVLSLSNTYQLKVLTLGTLIMFSFAAIYFSDSFDPRNGMFDQWMNGILGKLPYTFLFFTPLLMVTVLRHSISYDIFIVGVGMVYGICTALFIGLSLMYGNMSIWAVFGYKDKDAFKESAKYRKTERKHIKQ